MAVRITARGEESDEKIRKAGLTPGRINPSVSRRDGSHRTTTTYRDGEVSRVEDENLVSGGRTVSVIRREQVSQPVLLGVSDPVRQQSRYVTPFERVAYPYTRSQDSMSVDIRGSDTNGSGNLLRDREGNWVYNLRHGVILTDTLGSKKNKKIPPLSVEPWNKETNWYDIPGQLTNIARQAEFKSTSSRRSGSTSQAGQRAIAFGAGVGSGLTYPVFHPVDFVKSQWNLLTKPKQTFTAIKKELVTNPYGTVGQIIGGFLFGKGVGKVPKIARSTTFIGKSEVPAESIVEPRVLSGEQRFPTSKSTPSQLKAEFEIGKYALPQADNGVWHASGSPITGKVVGTGSSATPGLYGAPSLSKHFLRISGEGETKISLLPKNPRPTAQYVETDIGLIPKSYQGSLQKMNTYFETPRAKGRATISPEFYLGKGEKEAIIGTGTKLELVRQGNLWDKATGFKEYTTIEGKKVPIKRYTVNKGTTKSTIFKPTNNDFMKTSLETSEYKSGTQNYSLSELGSSISGIRGSNQRVSRSTRTGSYFSPISIPSYPSSPSKSYYAPSSQNIWSPTVISPRRGGGSSYRPPSAPSTPSYGDIIAPSSSTTTFQPITPSSPSSQFRISNNNQFKNVLKPSKGVSWTPKYFASIEATSLGIIGKKSKTASITGLGIRPIPL